MECAIGENRAVGYRNKINIATLFYRQSKLGVVLGQKQTLYKLNRANRKTASRRPFRNPTVFRLSYDSSVFTPPAPAEKSQCPESRCKKRERGWERGYYEIVYIIRFY